MCAFGTRCNSCDCEHAHGVCVWSVGAAMPAGRSPPLECVTFPWSFEVTRARCENEPRVSREVERAAGYREFCQTLTQAPRNAKPQVERQTTNQKCNHDMLVVIATPSPARPTIFLTRIKFIQHVAVFRSTFSSNFSAFLFGAVAFLSHCLTLDSSAIYNSKEIQ